MSKNVLVTGSSRGIGKAIAQQLAKDGFDIAVHCRSNTAQGEEVVAELKALGSNARLLQFDVSDRQAALEVINADAEEYGTYFGVVLNAGICRDNAFPSLTDDDWDSVIHTNLDGFYNVLKPIVMPMVTARLKGRIVTLSSLSGIIGNRGQVNYSASKAGIIGATKALAVEMAKRGITVNCVAPGLIDTEMVDDLPLAEIKKHIPMRRVGKVEEIASLVSYLFSPPAGYITRQVISVNGGMC